MEGGIWVLVDISDILRKQIKVEKGNRSRENVGEPAMRVVCLYVDLSNEG